MAISHQAIREFVEAFNAGELQVVLTGVPGVWDAAGEVRSGPSWVMEARANGEGKSLQFRYPQGNPYRYVVEDL